MYQRRHSAVPKVQRRDVAIVAHPVRSTSRLARQPMQMVVVHAVARRFLRGVCSGDGVEHGQAKSPGSILREVGRHMGSSAGSSAGTQAKILNTGQLTSILQKTGLPVPCQYLDSQDWHYPHDDRDDGRGGHHPLVVGQRCPADPDFTHVAPGDGLERRSVGGPVRVWHLAGRGRTDEPYHSGGLARRVRQRV